MVHLAEKQMKRLLLSLLVLAIFLPVFGQQKIELNNSFSAIEVSGRINVEIIPDPVCRIYVTSYGIDIQKLNWSIKDGLMSFTAPSGMFDNGKIEMKVYVDSLDYLVCNGCEVVMNSTLVGDKITIYSLNANNKLDLNFDVDKLFLKANGDSNIKLKGYANDALIDISVGAKLDASQSEMQTCRIVAIGGSEAVVNVVKHLNAKATTQATIYYMNSPELVVKTNTWGEVVPVPKF